MADWKIPLSDLSFGQEEFAAVNQVLESGWLTMGEQTKAFEAEFAAYHDVPYALAVSNCTAALHIACMLLDLGPGDEVIVPSLSFVATANAVRYTGATPIFADIASLYDLTIDPISIREKITEKTKAIIIMHYAGRPCQMDKVRALAKENNLYLIEDAAHAVGTKESGQYLGTWGDVGCFSFFSNKNLVTGEGGMVVTSNEVFANRAGRLRSHGMTTLTWDRHKGHAWSYDVVDLGYNYRIDEIRSAIGRVQLEKLANNNQARREIVRHYINLIAQALPEVTIPFGQVTEETNPHIMPIILPEGVDRIKVMGSLKERGVQTSIHYPPIHTFEDYRKTYGSTSLPNTEEAASRELTLPLYPELTENSIEYVVGCLSEAIQNT